MTMAIIIDDDKPSPPALILFLDESRLNEFRFSCNFNLNIVSKTKDIESSCIFSLFFKTTVLSSAESILYCFYYFYSLSCNNNSTPQSKLVYNRTFGTILSFNFSLKKKVLINTQPRVQIDYYYVVSIVSLIPDLNGFYIALGQGQV